MVDNSGHGVYFSAQKFHQAEAMRDTGKQGNPQSRGCKGSPDYSEATPVLARPGAYFEAGKVESLNSLPKGSKASDCLELYFHL